jgi:hypothetical protein
MPLSTIRVCPGVYPGNLHIDRDVTVIGAGDGTDPKTSTILDAAGGGRVVYIAPGVTVALHGLRLTGGTQDGAAGLLNDGTVEMTRCTVSGNNAGISSGGGIYNRGSGKFTLIDCKVTNNTAVFGGGIYQVSGQPAALHNTIVENNHATMGGGGIFVNSGRVTITDNSMVRTNTAVEDGGGVFNSGTVACSAGGSVSGNTVGGNPNNCIDSGIPPGMGCNSCPA